jgi:hypothetical protein
LVVGKAARAQLARVANAVQDRESRRVREIVKRMGQLLGLHRRQAMRLTGRDRVELLGDLV